MLTRITRTLLTRITRTLNFDLKLQKNHVALIDFYVIGVVARWLLQLSTVSKMEKQNLVEMRSLTGLGNHLAEMRSLNGLKNRKTKFS